MNSQILNAERRKCQRFQVSGNAFTINSGHNGLITDISMEGLSFHYVDRKFNGQQSPYLDIILDDENFRLSQLPFKKVSEKKASHNCPDASLIVKKCCVQFKGLSVSQKEQLAFFIDKFTDDYRHY